MRGISGWKWRAGDCGRNVRHEKIEHEAWFSEFIGEGPSGHALRKSGENSPYVGKFLGAR
jgi:ferritin-like protein